ncbi:MULTISPECIES: 6-phosphogluconolactonase [unclassified Microbacterium]|uniref:6-phosphogluconolactonase n=3 Tax=Microbacterium TaxID=33882 RepID=UPI00068FDBB2|nr:MULTISPECIES: 6-phosphogluconolactonase [unclassified Microbacterium]
MSTTTFALHAHPDRAAMGAAAARSAARTLREAVAARGTARMIAAAAPSQLDVYRALTAEPDVPWDRITILHMDEYLDLDPAAPQRFGNWLRTHLVDAVQPAAFHPMRTELGAEAATEEYAALLAEGPIDLVCLGIGVNGHIAFNDPPDADLGDPCPVRVVQLDLASRVQQVDDDCFDTLEAVPTHALTLTIPALMNGAHLVCAVPDARKAEAVRALVEEPISSHWPCTVLRRHSRCEVHVDRDAASLLHPAPAVAAPAAR